MDFKGVISEKRLEQIKSDIERLGMGITFKYFLADEIRLIIDQTILSDDERKMAEYKYLRKMKNREIYLKMQWESQSSCYSHIKSISYELRKTCQRMFV